MTCIEQAEKFHRSYSFELVTAPKDKELTLNDATSMTATTLNHFWQIRVPTILLRTILVDTLQMLIFKVASGHEDKLVLKANRTKVSSFCLEHLALSHLVYHNTACYTWYMRDFDAINRFEYVKAIVDLNKG